MNDKKKERYIQLGLLSGLVTLGLLVYVLVPGFYDDMWELILSGDVQRMAEVLQSYGPWAMVISFVLDVLINALGFLPSIFFSNCYLTSAV